MLSSCFGFIASKPTPTEHLLPPLRIKSALQHSQTSHPKCLDNHADHLRLHGDQLWLQRAQLLLASLKPGNHQVPLTHLPPSRLLPSSQAVPVCLARWQAQLREYKLMGLIWAIR